MTTPIAIFQGCVSTTGAGRSTAVTGETKNDGDESEVTYTICKGVHSLMETIDINQSLAVGFGPLGSVDQKMKFVKELKITSESLAIVVRARHVKGKQVQTSARLASDIAPPVGDSALRDFFLHYGDAYVSSITTGGEYIGVYSFYTETKSDRMKLELQLKGQGIFEFGTVNADLKVKLGQAVKDSNTQVSFKQMMLGLHVELPNQDDMVEFARKFPSQQLSTPKVLSFETTGYEHVVGVSNGFNPIASNRDILVGTGREDLGLAGDFAKISNLIDQIGVIRSFYDFYGGYSDGELSAVADRAKQDLVSLKKTFSAFQSDPISVPSKPQLPSLSKGTPQLQYSVKLSYQIGEARGNWTKYPFDFFTGVDAYIQTKTRITSIQMQSDDMVNRLTVEFESATGGSRKENYGSDRGNWGNKLVLGDGHFIKKISGRDGFNVDRLEFSLDDGRSLVAGGGGGGVFCFPGSNGLPEGSFIVGLQGLSSWTFDQIQFIYAAFQPAKWSSS